MIGRNTWALVAAAFLLAALAGGIWISNRAAPGEGGEPAPAGARSGPTQPRALAPVGLEIESDDGAGPFRLAVGDQRGLLAAVELEDGSVRYDAPIDWSSANPQIASIDSNGTLRAVAAGRVRITAELVPLTAEVEVSVAG